jgi:hypothetical protein
MNLDSDNLFLLLIRVNPLNPRSIALLVLIFYRTIK